MTKKAKQLSMMTMIVFIIMNFTLSMSSTLFNGILDKIAVELSIPLSKTGYLSSFYAYGAGIGVPIFLIVFRKYNRSILLKTMLFLNIIVTFLSLIAPNFTLLLMMRFLMGLTGNSYGVLATSNIAALSPKDKVGKNLSLLITGGASALMIGVPLTRTLVAMYSWQKIFIVLVGIMLCAWIYFLLNLPNHIDVEFHSDLKVELGLLKDKQVQLVLICSIINFIGYGAFYTYITPYLVTLFPQFDRTMSVILSLIGFCSFSGNLIGGIVCDCVGYKKALMLGTFVQILTGVCIVFTQNSAYSNLLFSLLWMFTGWFIGLQINTGIAVVTQSKSSLMISLNGSCISLGQAAGVSVASMIINQFTISKVIVLSLCTSICVLFILLAERKKGN